MATARRLWLSLLSLGGFCGAGIVLWQLVSSNQQLSSEQRKNYPEADPDTLADIQKQNELVFQVIKKAAETNKNVARNPPFRF